MESFSEAGSCKAGFYLLYLLTIVMALFCFFFRGAVQHGTCFTVSPRTAIVRMTTDEFCNATNRGELINRCQALNQSFSRPFLIVECANGGTGVGKAGNSPKLKDCAVTEECESVSLARYGHKLIFSVFFSIQGNR